MKPLTTQPVKGFRDIYPEQMRMRNWLFKNIRKTAHLFGYEEYDGPILEPLELYAAKSGDELVKKQTFQLTDRGDRALALRPELTPTLARMVASKQQHLTYPLRWFSIGPRFRYEAPQKGRGREFYQADFDIIGPNTPEADAEIISIACELLKSFELDEKEIVVKINSRAMLVHKLSLINIRGSKIPDIIQAIDKKDKMSENTWSKLLEDEGLSETQIVNLKTILTDRDVAFESEHLTAVFSILKDLGYSKFVEYDPAVVRGLEYYTGIVFEVRDRNDKFRAILGGGRYDNLVELFGTTPLSGVGFAVGDMVLNELLQSLGKLPKGAKTIDDLVLVTIFDVSTVRTSLKVTRMLREANIPTILYPDTKTKLDKQLKYADKKQIPYAIIIGPDEVKNKTVILKDLLKQSQREYSPDELINTLSTLR